MKKKDFHSRKQKNSTNDDIDQNRQFAQLKCNKDNGDNTEKNSYKIVEWLEQPWITNFK